jgi:uncharacterized membrane protein YoaK (UPF0700 family)
MFVAQAHSFTQQARLAITLAWIAGYTNIISVLACGTVTSHASGTTSNFGRDIAETARGTPGASGLAAYALFLLATFVAGAMVSSFTTELGRRRGWESIYVLPMAIEALLLSIFGLGLELNDGTPMLAGPEHYWMTGVASAAMGLQNATITRISSGVVRTTHVTGVLTDLGLEAVQFAWWLCDRLRGTRRGTAAALSRSIRAHPSALRLLLLASIIGSFALGAGLGTLLYDFSPRFSMGPAVLFLIWIVYQDVVRPIAEIEASRQMSAETIRGLPEALVVFHLRRDRNRRGKVHRLPDLDAWADRLAPAARVVVLDLGEVAHLDANAMAVVRSLQSKLKSQGRRLVVAGISGPQYEELRHAGGGEFLDPLSVCPDLELAVARGLMMVEHQPSAA